MSEDEEPCEMFHFADEFEEFRARSYSGGFLLLDWPQGRTDKRSSLPNWDVDTTSLHLANIALEEVSSSEDEVEEELNQKQQSLLKSTRRSVFRSTERSSGRRGDRMSRSEGRLKDIAAFSTERNRQKKDVLSISKDMETAAEDDQSQDEVDTIRPISGRHSPIGGAKLERSRHLSLKTSSARYGACPGRPKTNPPAIHVSLHRQVASDAPSAWDADDPEADEDEWRLGSMRPRVFSLPDGPLYRPRLSTISAAKESQLKRMRSFTITRKGLRKEYKQLASPTTDQTEARSTTNGASPDGSTGGTTNDGGAPMRFKVVLVGDPNVGKQTIIKRFVSERDMSFSFDDETDKSVSILLDGEESTMEFVDMSDRKVDEEVTGYHVDAYVVVYSVEDRRSFESAINRLYEIRETEGRHVALILVANKTDLVRSRAIQEEEGKAAANTYDSKYIEVSAAIDHKIDELLVGVLKQIRLINKKYHSPKPGWKFGRDPSAFLDNCCLLQARENVLAKLFKGETPTSKSCDNLYVL